MGEVVVIGYPTLTLEPAFLDPLYMGWGWMEGQSDSIWPKFEVWLMANLVPISSNGPKDLAPKSCHIGRHIGKSAPSDPALV